MGLKPTWKPPSSTGPARLKYSCTVRKKRCPKDWLTGESESVMFFICKKKHCVANPEPM